MPYATSSITVTPVPAYPTSTVKVNGSPVASGAASGPLDLTVGSNTIPVVVTAVGGLMTQTYTVTVTRLPEVFAFNAAADVPVTANGFGHCRLHGQFRAELSAAARDQSCGVEQYRQQRRSKGRSPILRKGSWCI